MSVSSRADLSTLTQPIPSLITRPWTALRRRAWSSCRDSQCIGKLTRDDVSVSFLLSSLQEGSRNVCLLDVTTQRMPISASVRISASPSRTSTTSRLPTYCSRQFTNRFWLDTVLARRPPKRLLEVIWCVPVLVALSPCATSGGRIEEACVAGMARLLEEASPY